MSKFYSLFSSSKGNASFVGSPAGGVLVDAGVSCRRLLQSLAAHDIPEKAVQAVCITHTHTDHIAGLRVFLGKHPVPVYGTAETLAQLRFSDKFPQDADLREILPTETIHTDSVAVTAFPTMHDAPGSCGYRFELPDGQTCAVCTDLGCVTPEVEKGVLGADLVLLEANYDPKMLRYGPYPASLQERIRGKYGHLSNGDSRDGGNAHRTRHNTSHTGASQRKKQYHASGTADRAGTFAGTGNAPEPGFPAAGGVAGGLRTGGDLLMQTIQILALGKCKESYLRDACREYEKRLSRFCQLQVTELEPVSLPQNPSEKEIAAALEKEGAELLKRAKGFCIAMCIEGKQLDSPGLAKKLEQAAQGGDSGAVTFLIGSSYGLSDAVKQRANLRLSMSAMTFPHQLARVMLLEQIYRSYQILSGTKYHK